MKFLLPVVCILIGTSAIPSLSFAHRAFLVPSSTIVTGKSAWVSIDAAAASNVFEFDHQPLKLDNLKIISPDGKLVSGVNSTTGKFRSSFDVELAQIGTYKISLVNSNVMANYKEEGVAKRWRGKAENAAKEIPKSATDLVIIEQQGRIETFVSNGKPNQTALTASSKGLELEAISHPNDLVENEKGQFRLLLDGKPCPATDITIIKGGIRYRQKLNEQTITSDADGKFSIQWQGAGLYWIEAEKTDQITSVVNAKERRNSYVATFEILPQ